MSEKLKISSPFCSEHLFPVVNVEDKDFVHYQEVEKVSPDYDPEHPSEFLIEKSVEEYERIPIREYINSFASKVGLKNELKGIVSKQQMDDYIELHKARPGYTDLTKLPDSAFGMTQLAERVDACWDEIPSELKGSLTKEEFLKTLSVDKIREYVISQLPKESVKEEGEK